MKKRFTFPLKTCFLVFIAGITNACAQPGSLDNTFSFDGFTFVECGGIYDAAEAIALQPDGKIVVGGHVKIGSQSQFMVARFNTDGSIDNTFDGDGYNTTAFATFNNTGRALAIQPDGKIILVGGADDDNDLAMVRYNSDGSLDNTFDSDGIVITNVGTGTNTAYDVVLQPDGKILVSGEAKQSGIDFAVMRYNTDGSLDNTFDSDGKLLVSFNTLPARAYGIGLQPDGKIVLGGMCMNASTSHNEFALARVNTDGTIDSTFGIDGKVSTAIAYSAIAYDLLILPDGKIVLGGSSGSSGDDFTLARYNSDGTIDMGFDSDGIATVNISGSSSDLAQGMALHTDGKIVLAGMSFGGPFGSSSVMSMVRFNADGTPDNTFDTDGIVTTTMSGMGFAGYDVVVQPDNKLVMCGSMSNSAVDQVAVTRYSGGSVGTNEMKNPGISISIYPNPVSNQLSIVFEKPVQKARLRLMHIDGKIVFEKTNASGNSFSIDVSQQPSGIYLLEVSNEGNISHQKIVVNR